MCSTYQRFCASLHVTVLSHSQVLSLSMHLSISRMYCPCSLLSFKVYFLSLICNLWNSSSLSVSSVSIVLSTLVHCALLNIRTQAILFFLYTLLAVNYPLPLLCPGTYILATSLLVYSSQFRISSIQPPFSISANHLHVFIDFIILFTFNFDFTIDLVLLKYSRLNQNFIFFSLILLRSNIPRYLQPSFSIIL